MGKGPKRGFMSKRLCPSIQESSYTILSRRIRDWKTRAAMLWKGVNSIPVHSMVPTRFLVPSKQLLSE